MFEGLIWHGDGGGWNVQKPRPIPDMTKMIPNDRKSADLQQLTQQTLNSQGDAGAHGHGHGRGEFDEYYDISYHPNWENLGALNAY